VQGVAEELKTRGVKIGFGHGRCGKWVVEGLVKRLRY